MARRKLTVFSKLLITLLIVGGLFFGYTYLKNNGYLEGLTDNGGGTEKPKKPAKKDKNADVINIGVVTWGGYAGGQYFNEGFEANTDSRFYKDYGFQVEFKILDDFIASRKAFENDEVQLLWATVDAFPDRKSVV